MSLPAKLEELLGLFDLMNDREERIALLIDTADRFREVPPEVAARPFPEERRVPNCESEAFVWARANADGGLDLDFAVENPQGISAKAMAVILQETLAGAPLAEIAELPADLPYRIFGRELSMGKNMGLLGMVQAVQRAARAELGERPD